jgi:hypothetical protein
MSGRILSLVGSIAVAAALIMSGARVGVPNTARADNCLTAPNSSAPPGSRWYYHVDRMNQRKCWYLRASGQPAQPATAQATSEAAPAAQSHSTPAPTGSTPTTGSAGAPMARSFGNTAPALPHVKKHAVKPKAGPLVSAKTDKVIQQRGQVRSTAPSVLETSAPQSSTSAQTSAQADGPAPAPPAAWPDAPPTVATVKAHQRIAVPTDTRADSIRPKADALTSNDAESTARGDEPTTKTGTAGPPKMFVIFALGLAVIGTLSRILMKIAAAHRARVDFDRINKSTAGKRGSTIRTSRTPSVNGKNTTHLYRAQGIAAPVSHSQPTTSGRDTARDKDEISNGDDTLAQLNPELDLAAIAEGRASWWPKTPLS